MEARLYGGRSFGGATHPWVSPPMASPPSAMASSSTDVASSSVTARSWGSPDVQTQRKGPNPWENMSLQAQMPPHPGPLACWGRGCRCEHAREEGSASGSQGWNPLSCHWTESSRGLPVPSLCPSAPSPPSLPPGCTISSYRSGELGPGQTEMTPIAVTDDKKIRHLKVTVTLRGESTWGCNLGELALGELIFPGARLQDRAVLGGGCRGLGPPWAAALAGPGGASSWAALPLRRVPADSAQPLPPLHPTVSLMVSGTCLSHLHLSLVPCGTH